MRIVLWGACLVVASATAGWLLGITQASPVYEVTEVIWLERSRMEMLDGITCYFRSHTP